MDNDFQEYESQQTGLFLANIKSHCSRVKEFIFKFDFLTYNKQWRHNYTILKGASLAYMSLVFSFIYLFVYLFIFFN